MADSKSLERGMIVWFAAGPLGSVDGREQVEEGDSGVYLEPHPLQDQLPGWHLIEVDESFQVPVHRSMFHTEADLPLGDPATSKEAR